MASGQAQLFFLLCLLTTGKRILPPSQLPGGAWNCIPFCYVFNYPFSRASLKLSACSQPDLCWNAAKGPSPCLRPAAARRRQAPKNLCLWHLGDLDT